MFLNINKLNPNESVPTLQEPKKLGAEDNMDQSLVELLLRTGDLDVTQPIYEDFSAITRAPLSHYYYH